MSLNRKLPSSEHILLVDDRPWSVQTIVEAFSTAGWRITQKTSLSEGILALKSAEYTAAVFDLRLPRPILNERLELEEMGVPIGWVDSVDEFSVGTVLGRFVRERLGGQLPFLYISAMALDVSGELGQGATAGLLVIDKTSSLRDVTLGDEVLKQVMALIDERGRHLKEDRW